MNEPSLEFHKHHCGDWPAPPICQAKSLCRLPHDPATTPFPSVSLSTPACPMEGANTHPISDQEAETEMEGPSK